MDRRRLKRLTCAAAALALLASPACAGLRNDVPSCYTANRITPAGGLGYDRLIYVLVDQTVGWTPDLEQSVLDNLNANLQPGTKFVIAQFSAFAQGRYLDVIHTGIMESAMPPAQVNNTAIRKTTMFDACLAGQRNFALAMADASLRSAFGNSSSTLGHSDIMSALQAVSAAIAGDPAPAKLLFLASDGLENSSVTSFYRHDTLRNIDPAAELRLASAAGMLGDFGGSLVYVIGGALQAGNAGYRSPTLLEHLRNFWQLYFSNSNARLVEFGEPALLQPVILQNP